jgi:hypothetical protein
MSRMVAWVKKFFNKCIDSRAREWRERAESATRGIKE